MLLVLINVLVIIVVGAILFYLIDRFVRDGRLANLLKILVALVCLAAILQRLLPAFDINLFEATSCDRVSLMLSNALRSPFLFRHRLIRHSVIDVGIFLLGALHPPTGHL